MLALTMLSLREQKDDFDATSVGPESKVKVDVDGKKVTVVVGEIIREEGDNPTHTHYMRNADGFMIVYSASSREQFNEVTEWTNKILTAKDTNEAPIAIVGTHRDKDKDARVVTAEEGKSMADGLNCLFFDVNATCSDEVNTVFTTLVRMVIRERSEVNKADKKKGKGSKDHDCVLM